MNQDPEKPMALMHEDPSAMTEEMHTRRKIEQTLDLTYEQADNVLAVFSVFSAFFAILLGVMNQLLVSAAVYSAFMLGLFFAFKRYVLNRALKTMLLGPFWSFWVQAFVILSNGQIQMGFAFYIFLFVLIIYQNRSVLLVTTSITLIFNSFIYLAILLETPLDDLVRSYGLNIGKVRWDGYLWTLFMNLVAGGIGVWLADLLRGRTIENITRSVNQERQLEIFERNKRFADRIAQGGLDTPHQVAKDDELGRVLDQMRHSLLESLNKERKLQETSAFTSKGTALVDQILRQETRDLKALGDRLISQIVRYLGASHGAFFLLETPDNEPPYLEMLSVYAYERHKYLSQRIYQGDGLLGELILEKETIFLTDVPEEFIHIRSGMGGQRPSSVLMLPIKLGESITGALELASFQVFQPHQAQFLEVICDHIGASFASIRSQAQTQRLLAETERLAENMRLRESGLLMEIESLKAENQHMAKSIALMKEQLEWRRKVDHKNYLKDLGVSADEFVFSDRRMKTDLPPAHRDKVAPSKPRKREEEF